MKMAEKMKADIVITGPTFDYHEFAIMAAELAEHIQNNSKVPVISAIAKEKNEDVIQKYAQKILIVKMPKKGDPGLSESLANLVKGCEILVNKGDIKQFKQQYCY